MRNGSYRDVGIILPTILNVVVFVLDIAKGLWLIDVEPHVGSETYKPVQGGGHAAGWFNHNRLGPGCGPLHFATR